MSGKTPTSREACLFLPAVAREMTEAVCKERGMAGRYDAARKVYIRKEEELLGRVARGSARGFAELDALRRSPLYFPPTMFEGVVDFGPGAKNKSHHMQQSGDYLLMPRRQGDSISQHPATLGFTPVAVPGTSRRSMAVDTTHGSQLQTRVCDARVVVATARPLGEGWTKLRSRSDPTRSFYAHIPSNRAQWNRPD